MLVGVRVGANVIGVGEAVGEKVRKVGEFVGGGVGGVKVGAFVGL